ncbi:MAG: DegV family protein [Clostridia bacterium]|nr:DegV family protein [Clostridia bacterium]
MVKIITDSAADYTAEELKQKDIICIPMGVAFGEKDYRIGVNLTNEEFYELLETESEFPKTAQPPIFEIEKTFKEIKESGDECVAITISSELSGTYQSFFITKDMTEFDNCYVIDSQNATAGQKLLVDLAVKLRDEGRTAEEIADKLNEVKEKIVVLACIDTLEYLYKGGRLSKAAYAVGSAVNLKPIIAVTKEGKVEASAKTLSIRRGMKTLMEEFGKNPPDTEYPIYTVYSYDRKNTDILADKIREMGYEIDEENVVSLGPAIGAHIGKYACGYIYVEK